MPEDPGGICRRKNSGKCPCSIVLRPELCTMLRLGCHVEKAVPRLGPKGGGTLFEKGRSRNERLVRLSGGGDLSEESRRGHGTGRENFGRKFRGR